MYAGPIEKIYKDMEVKVEQQLEETIIRAVKECDIEVDKEELIKALEYDRNQYQKGFNDALDKIREEIVCLTYYWCEVNPNSVKKDVLEIIDKYKESEILEEMVDEFVRLERESDKEGEDDQE